MLDGRKATSSRYNIVAESIVRPSIKGNRPAKWHANCNNNRSPLKLSPRMTVFLVSLEGLLINERACRSCKPSLIHRFVRHSCPWTKCMRDRRPRRHVRRSLQGPTPSTTANAITLIPRRRQSVLEMVLHVWIDIRRVKVIFSVRRSDFCENRVWKFHSMCFEFSQRRKVTDERSFYVRK